VRRTECLARCWVLRDRAVGTLSGPSSVERLTCWGLRLGSGARGDPWDGFRPYLENFIVDASIKVRSLCSDKLLRAHGGCLGIKSRRRP
jgi:hypothetical protein